MTASTAADLPPADGPGKALAVLALPAYLLLLIGWGLLRLPLIGIAFGDATTQAWSPKADFGDDLVLLACASAIVLFSTWLGERRRLVLPILLIAGGAAEVLGAGMVAPGLVTPRAIGALAIVAIDLVRAGVPVLLMAALFTTPLRSGPARVAGLVIGSFFLAMLCRFAVNLIVHKINADVESEALVIRVCGVGAAVAAVALAGRAAMTRRGGRWIAAEPSASAKAALEGIWRCRSSRLAAIAWLVALCAVVGLDALGGAAAIGKGVLTPKQLVIFLIWSGVSAVVAIAVAAVLADKRRRRDPGADHTVASAFLAASIPVFLFGLYDASVFQARCCFALAWALAWAAAAPALVALLPRRAQGSQQRHIALYFLVVNGLGAVGLPALAQWLALSVAGLNGALATGFWGRLQTNFPFAPTQTVHFLLPVRLDMVSTDAEAGLRSLHTAVFVLLALTAAGAGLFFLGAKTRRQEEQAALSAADPARTCAACGATNAAAARFCTRCGAPLPHGPAQDATPAELRPARVWRNWTSPIVLSLGAAVLLAAVAAWACGEGVLEPRLDKRIVWKAPDTAFEATQACRDVRCLTDYMKAHGASPQAIVFTRRLGQRFNGDLLGYADDLKGAGRVKAAEVFLPSLLQTGATAYVFVNARTPLIRADEAEVETMAAGNPDYSALHTQYPQAMIWPGQEFVREDRLSLNGQRFVFGMNIVNGCHACDLLGQILVGYEFDGRGRFQGASVLGVERDKRAEAVRAYSEIAGRLPTESAFQQTFTQAQPDGQVLTATSTTWLMSQGFCQLAVRSQSTAFGGQPFVLENDFSVNAAAVARAPGSNALRINCKGDAACLSQDYSDARGHAQRLPSWGVTVTPEQADAVVNDLEAMQRICASAG